MKRRQRGAITVFLAIILIASMALESVFVEAVHINIAKAQAEKALDDAIYSAMSEYEKQLFEMYGIFGVDGQTSGIESLLAATQRFLDDSLQTVNNLNNEYRPMGFDSPDVTLKASLPLSDPDVLCNQAIGQMKIQAPWQMVNGLGNVVNIDFGIDVAGISVTDISGTILNIVNGLIDISEKAKENCEIIKDGAEVTETTNNLYTKTWESLKGSCSTKVKKLPTQLDDLATQYEEDLEEADEKEAEADALDEIAAASADAAEKEAASQGSALLRNEAKNLRDSAARDFILGLSRLFQAVENTKFRNLKTTLNSQISAIEAKIQQTGNGDSSGSMGAALDASVMSMKKDVQRLKALVGVIDSWALVIDRYVPNGSGNKSLSVGSGKTALPNATMIQAVRDGDDPRSVSQWDDLKQDIAKMVEVADSLPSLSLDLVEGDWKGADLEKDTLLSGNAERIKKLTFQHSLKDKRNAGWMEGASTIEINSEDPTLWESILSGLLSIAGHIPVVGLIIQIINSITSFINLLKSIRDGLAMENLYLTEYILSNFSNSVQAFSTDGAIMTLLGMFGSDDLLKTAKPLVNGATEIMGAILPGDKDDILAYRTQEDGEPNSTASYATDEVEYILCSAGLWTDDLIDPGGSLGKRLLAKNKLDPNVGDPLYDVARVTSSLFLIKFLLNLVQGFVDPEMLAQAAGAGLVIGTPATMVLFMSAETIIDMILMMIGNHRVPLLKVGEFYVSLKNLAGTAAGAIIGGITKTISVASEQLKKGEDESLKLTQSIIYDFNVCLNGNYTVENITQTATTLINRYGRDLATPIINIREALIVASTNGQHVSDTLLAYTFEKDLHREVASGVWDIVFDDLAKEPIKEALKKAIQNSLDKNMNMASSESGDGKENEGGKKKFEFKLSASITMSYVDFLRVNLWVALINNRDAVIKAMQEVMQVNIKYYLEQRGESPGSFALKDRYACLSGKADVKTDFVFLGQAFLPASVKKEGKYNFSVWSSRTY